MFAMFPRRAKRARGSAFLAWMMIGALLIGLAGCGNPPSTATSQEDSTPLSLPAHQSTPGSTPTTPVTADTDWTTYHHDNSRTGYIATTPDPRHLTRIWRTTLDGAVYAEPLTIGNHVIVATEGDSLYSLNAATGQVAWRTHVGTPVPLSTLPCGDIDPLGITGTPVYDPATKLVFAVAEITGPGHILVGLDVNTGKVLVRRSADPAGIDPRAHQERSALALSQGKVYIAYGGLAGDCSDYRGRVVALQTDGNGPMLTFTVPTPREGGIWTPPGPSVDAKGNIFVSVGNGEVTQGNWDHSDSVLRLSPTLQLEDGFAPVGWRQENATDADLGSMGPLLLPNGLIFADGKSGLGYLLHADKLGGVGGQADVTSVCHAFGGSAAIGLQMFVPCTEGLREVQVGSGPRLVLGWQASSRIVGSPVVGGHTVYSLDPGGTLYALNAADGNIRASVSVGTTSRFATPTISGSRIFVGTMSSVAGIAIL